MNKSGPVIRITKHQKCNMRPVNLKLSFSFFADFVVKVANTKLRLFHDLQAFLY